MKNHETRMTGGGARVPRAVDPAGGAGRPCSGSNGHTAGGGAGLAIAAQIVEVVSGVTFWDYVHEYVFGRCGMTGSGFYTREQWLTDEHIAHSYMRQPDGSRVDAVRNLDKDSLSQQGPGENPGGSFIGYAAANGFATAPDLVRFAHALSYGTVHGLGSQKPGRQRHDGDVVRPEVLRLCDGEADDGRLGQVVEQRAAVAVGEDFVVDHTPYATLLGDHATPLDEALAATLK